MFLYIIFFLPSFVLTSRLWLRIPFFTQQPAARGRPVNPLQFLADRAESDVDDPDLGAAALEDDAEGGGGTAGDFRPSTTFADWPEDNAKREVAPRHRPGASQPGAGSAAAPGGPGGGKKRRAVPTLFGSRPKKPKGSAAATRRDEAATKAICFRKEVKKPPLVSA